MSILNVHICHLGSLYFHVFIVNPYFCTFIHLPKILDDPPCHPCIHAFIPLWHSPLRESVFVMYSVVLPQIWLPVGMEQFIFHYFFYLHSNTFKPTCERSRAKNFVFSSALILQKYTVNSFMPTFQHNQ